jgi:hypothetical protein
MFDRTRLSRLITLALASCAVTWAFAGAALARPDNPPQTAAPAYKTVAGDTDKVPLVVTRGPAYSGVVADANKTPDAAVVDRNLATLSHGGKTGAPVATTGPDHTGTIALITAIAAMLVALMAVTLMFVRPQGPVLR